MKITYVATAVVLLLLSLWMTAQARRAWAGRPLMVRAQRTAAAQAVILFGAALVVGVVGITPTTSSRPGPAALMVGGLGIAVILAGGLAAVLIVTADRPRFMIPPQQRTQPGALAGPAMGGQSGALPTAPDPAAEFDEDALLLRAVGGLGAGAAMAAHRLRKNVHEISLTMPMPPGQAAARARQLIADLGSVVQPGDDADGGPVRVVGIIGAGALNMNPTVVAVVIRPTGQGSSVIVRGAAKEGLIKQRAGEDAAKRLAAALA